MGYNPTPPVGQAGKAFSLPVVIASDQVVPVSSQVAYVEASEIPAITAVTYTPGWQLGGVLSFNVGNVGRGAMVVAARVLDKAKQNVPLVLDLFQNLPTLGSANAQAYDISDANAAAAVWEGAIDFHPGNYRSRVSNSSCFGSILGDQPQLPVITPTTFFLYGVLYTLGAPTYASTTDLTVYLGVNQF